MACVLSGALMIGSYSPVLAKTEAKAVSATATDKDGAEAKTDAAKADDKKEDTAKGEVLEDGVYSAEFDTDSSMFHVNEANDGKGTLTVKDGKAVRAVSGDRPLSLYGGIAEGRAVPSAGGHCRRDLRNGYSGVRYGWPCPPVHGCHYGGPARHHSVIGDGQGLRRRHLGRAEPSGPDLFQQAVCGRRVRGEPDHRGGPGGGVHRLRLGFR